MITPEIPSPFSTGIPVRSQSTNTRPPSAAHGLAVDVLEVVTTWTPTTATVVGNVVLVCPAAGARRPQKAAGRPLLAAQPLRGTLSVGHLGRRQLPQSDVLLGNELPPLAGHTHDGVAHFAKVGSTYDCNPDESCSVNRVCTSKVYKTRTLTSVKVVTSFTPLWRTRKVRRILVRTELVFPGTETGGRRGGLIDRRCGFEEKARRCRHPHGQAEHDHLLVAGLYYLFLWRVRSQGTSAEKAEPTASLRVTVDTTLVRVFLTVRRRVYVTDDQRPPVLVCVINREQMVTVQGLLGFQSSQVRPSRPQGGVCAFLYVRPVASEFEGVPKRSKSRYIPTSTRQSGLLTLTPDDLPLTKSEPIRPAGFLGRPSECFRVI